MEGIILSSWDHIMGPQIEKLWHVNLKTITPVPEKFLQDFNMSKNCTVLNSIPSRDLALMKVYTVMCRQLLLGEVDSNRNTEEWSSRLYITENKILLAIMFHIEFWKCSNSIKDTKNVCLCLGIIFNHGISSKLSILYNHLLIDKYLRKTVNSFKNSQFSIDTCLNEITALVEDVNRVTAMIDKFNFTSVTSPTSYSWLSNYFPLSQAIASHIQTSGCTVVLGLSKFLIDEVIYLLTLFSPKRNHSNTRGVKFSKSYIIGLHIRNTNEGADKSGKFLLDRASKESCPLTVIDLNEMKVWQTIPFQENSKSDKKSACLITETGSTIPELITDLIFLEKNGRKDCHNYVKDFCHVLMAKSCSLIKTVERYRNAGKFLSKKDVMTMFAIQNHMDLEILFGWAENLKPGIRNSVLNQL